MTTPDRPVRVRLAPSPTGYMHVGTARTALFNWFFARHTGGTFLLRVEDTDRSRYVADALEDLLDGLRWLGLAPDEGPTAGGPCGPYFQSQRLDLYRDHARQLVAAGHAYRCYCSPARLEAVRAERFGQGLKLGYDRRCRELSAAEIAAHEAAGAPSVIRLKMPLDGALTLRDVIRGDITVRCAEMEDVVLLKSDGYPTYHLAVVVDDHLMGVTHVLRADEWIPSSPVQVRLYAAFGWPEPVWAHLPVVLNPSGQGKLSKRKSVDKQGHPIEQMIMVRDYRRAGYLPEAMVNYLATLGWAYSGDEEVFSRQAAVERFQLRDINPSPSAWNPEKLRWMNGVYIRALEPDDLAERLLPFLRDAGLPADLAMTRRLVPLVRERITTLPEAVPWLDFFWADEVRPSAADLVPARLTPAETVAILAAAEAALAATESWDRAALETALRAVAEQLGHKPGPVFQPVRVAATGRKVSPPLFETLEILGRSLVLARLAAARRLLPGEA